ncbi:MAG: hypothetical protein OXH92_03650, partial [Bryobacterales bacterium]|nr:hypothetical protein [Bryobacterales bacterium]
MQGRTLSGPNADSEGATCHGVLKGLADLGKRVCPGEKLGKGKSGVVLLEKGYRVRQVFRSVVVNAPDLQPSAHHPFR